MLHGRCSDDAAIAKKLQYEYEVVQVDIGKWDKHLDLAASYGADPKQAGVPYLSILDAQGKLVANVATEPFETKVDGVPGYDSAKLVAMLTEHQAPYWKAEERFQAALADAKTQQKRVFVHFGAPW